MNLLTVSGNLPFVLLDKRLKTNIFLDYIFANIILNKKVYYIQKNDMVDNYAQ